METLELPDSLKYDLITFASFEENLDQETEYFIYKEIDLGTSAFYNGLYAQSVENLLKSLDFKSKKFVFCSESAVQKLQSFQARINSELHKT